MAVVVTAVVVTAAVLAVAVAVDAPVVVVVVVVVVVTAAVLAVAVDAPVAVVVTAVAVAATKLLPEWGQVPQSIKGPRALFSWSDRVCDHVSVARCLRGRPDNTLSYSAFGNIRSNLATQPICQGITR